MFRPIGDGLGRDSAIKGRQQRFMMPRQERKIEIIYP